MSVSRIYDRLDWVLVCLFFMVSAVSGLADTIMFLEGMAVDNLSSSEDNESFEFPSGLNRDHLLNLKRPEQDEFSIKSGNPYRNSGFRIHPNKVRQGMELLQVAQLYVENNKPQRARQQIELAMEGNLNHRGLLQKAAALAATARLYDMANMYFTRAIDLDPENPHLLAAWAGVQIRMGNLAKAKELLKRAEALDTRNLAVMLNMTILCLLNGTPEDISPLWGRLRLKEMQTMVDWLEVDKDEYSRILGDAGYSKLCDYVIGPGTAFCMPQIKNVLEDVIIYTRASDRVNLISSYRLLLEFGVEKLWIRMQLAETLIQEGQQDEALSLLTTLVRDYPDSMIVLYNFGYFSIRAQKYKQALSILKKAHRIAPERAVIAFWLACAYVQTRQPEKAWPLLNRIAQHDPEQFNKLMREGAEYLKPIMSDPRFKAISTTLDY